MARALQRKITVSIAGLAIAVAGVAMLALTYQAMIRARHEACRRARELAGVAALHLDPRLHDGGRGGAPGAPDDAAGRLHQALRRISERVPDVRSVALLRREPDGAIVCVAQAARAPEAEDPPGARIEDASPELQAAFERPETRVEARFDGDARSARLSAYAPVPGPDGRLDGVLAVHLTVDRVRRHERELAALALGCFGASILLSLLLGGYVGRRLAAPLRILRQDVDRLGRGDLSGPLPDARRTDDTGALAAVFNRMVAQLQQARSERRQDSEERQCLEDRFRMLIEHAPYGVAVLRPTGEFETINQRFTELFGYEIGDLPTSERWFELAYPEPAYRLKLAAAWQHELARASVPGQLPAKTVVVRTRAGRDRLVSIRGIVLKDSRCLVLFEDVTQSRLSEAEIAARNRELSILYRLSQIALQPLPLDALFDAITAEISGTLGFPLVWIKLYNPERGSFVLKGARGIFKDLPAGEVEVPMDQTLAGVVVRTGKTLAETRALERPEYSHEGLRRLGIQTYLGVPMTVGQTEIGVLSLCDTAVVPLTDQAIAWAESTANYVAAIIERRRVQDELRLQSAALACAANGVVIADREGKIVWANAAFTRLTGYRLEEAVGQNLRFLKSGRQNDAFYKTLWETITAGLVWHGTLVNKRKDGSLYDEEMTLTPLTSETGEVTHFIAIKQDISERKQMEQQLVQAQKMESVGRLAGGIAHDFNNLLQTILGFSELLLAGLPERDERRDDLAEIQRAARRAATLTSQLLAFSRKQMIRAEPLDLNTLVRDAAKMLQRLIGEDIQLLQGLADPLWRVKADAGQIEQVVMNLVVNARDAMPRGGRITITTANVLLQAQDVRVFPESQEGRYVCLAVSDTGTGMSKEVMAHLFEPFFTTKGVGQGTGMGLAMVYGLIKQHGGWINVYSEEGQGATFKIYLPALAWDGAGPEAEPAGDDAAGRRSGKGERILLVEDDAGVRALSILVLQTRGYAVFSAVDAQSALALFAREGGRFDLLFSDVVLPDKNGIELAEELLARRPELKVLMTSGYTDERSRWPVIGQRGWRFLQKPFASRELLAIIRALLDWGSHLRS